jgi:phosphopentomutase
VCRDLVPAKRNTGKVVFIVLDSVGVGELPDAELYGDAGSNTLVNTAAAVGGLKLPNLECLGLGNIASIRSVNPVERPAGCYGKMREISQGKDSTIGHWELAGIITKKAFPTYPDGFPPELIQKFLDVTEGKGILGNKPASGTVIIQEYGDEHRRTGYPIVYTSSDSVFQIAAHEEVIPLDLLYEMCRKTRDEVCVGKHAVGRVIARPFVGEKAGGYVRTANRRDFALEPPRLTLLDLLMENDIPTVGIGKIDDLFAGRGLMTKIHTKSNEEGIERIIQESRDLRRGFLMANLVDFDMLYGHRNDPAGFARALEYFDSQLGRILDTLDADDLLVITADHGNDPTTPSTDHSREYVPIICFQKSGKNGVNLGTRQSFADAGKSVAEYFDVDEPDVLAGESFLSTILSSN